MRSQLGQLGRTLRKTSLISAPQTTERQTVYLTHVKWITGKQQLTNYFSKYGAVRSVNMFFDPVSGLHRGFASLTFEDANSATAAIEHRPHVIDGDRVDVEFFSPLRDSKTKFLVQ